MIELCVTLHWWAAMAAFRAAVPHRLAEETDIDPRTYGIGVEPWGRWCRIAGSLLTVGATLLAVYVSGLFEGLVLVAAAGMFASAGVILLAPIASQFVWGFAGFCLASAPVTVVLTLVYGGAHGAG